MSQNFIDVDQAVLYEVLLAANYLDMKCVSPTVLHSRSRSFLFWEDGEVWISEGSQTTSMLDAVGDFLVCRSVAIAESCLRTVRGLLDLCCKTVANIIKGKNPDEIREYFKIVKDFTPAEEEEVRRENS